MKLYSCMVRYTIHQTGFMFEFFLGTNIIGSTVEFWKMIKGALPAHYLITVDIFFFYTANSNDFK